MSEAKIKHCSECLISSEEVILFLILLPPTITERTYLCRKCMDVAIDNSKKSMKGVT